MMAPICIQVTSEGPLVHLTVKDNKMPDASITVVLSADQARELSRMIRNAANFVAAQAPAEGNA